MTKRANTFKNVVIVLALAGATGVFVTQRLLPWLAQRAVYSDGESTYELGRDEGVRFAVWDPAERLAGEANSPARESRPALAPDGRTLVFAVGEPGANAELYVAELVDGEARRARPLTLVNSAGDDLAPAFGERALYFASNRPGGAGGFDLYAAAWDGERFEPPEPVGGGVNTGADELDPAPLGTPGLAERNGHFGWRERLAFASNRGQGGRGDLDLFLALAGGAEGRIDVVAFPGLNSPLDDREPCFASDGSALWFSSDRGGDFDLYRALSERGDWLPPEPLSGLNSGAHERGPLAAAGGFELWFSREAAARPAAPGVSEGETPQFDGPELGGPELDGGELFRARSRELHRVPEPPRGWLDLLLLAALLLLALLAWLSQRWEQLDILYKCFLVSLLLHLLLMWLLREVYPERGEYDLPGGGREPTFQVRVLSDRAPTEAGLSERSGALELAWKLDQSLPAQPERTELAARAPELAPALPAPERIEREAREAALAPARRATEVAAAEAVQRAESPALEDREAPLERIAATAPRLALPDLDAAAAPLPETRSDLPEAEPGRLVLTAANDVASRRVAVGPPSSRLERERGALAAPERFETRTRELPRTALERALVGPAVAMPAPEAPATTAAPAPEVALPTPAREASPAGRPVDRADADAPAPARAALEASPAPALAVQPELAGATPDLRRRSLEGPRPERYVPAREPLPAPAAPRLAGPELARPGGEERPQAVLAGPAPALSFGGPRALASLPDRSTPAGSRPMRRELAALALREERPRPSPRPLRAARPAPEALPPAEVRDLAERHAELTPYRNRFGTEKKVAIETFGGGADTEAAVARGLAYLARRQSREGYWGDAAAFHPKYRQVAVGKSGLALLAFLGAGHTHRSGTEYSENVERVIGWLRSVQDDRTGHFGNSSSYSHGIASYALAECYALTGDDELKRPLERAVGQILRNQIPTSYRGDRRMVGGWSYYYPDGSTYDAWPRVSISSWQVMALESARLGGLIVPDQALELARDFIVGSWDERLGAVRYSHDPDRLSSGYPTLPGSTPAGLFVLSLLGEDIASDRFSAPRNYLLRRMPDGYRFTGEDDFVFRAQGNVYFWYYGSLALMRAGGAEWERWNAALKATLLPAQLDDGSWRPLDVYAEYAGDDRADSIYTTSLCVLTLEVYYRYFTPLLERR